MVKVLQLQKYFEKSVFQLKMLILKSCLTLAKKLRYKRCFARQSVRELKVLGFGVE